MAKGAGIGFLVGAAAGAVVATMANTSALDHREDGYLLAYIFFVPAGAVVGTVLGAVLGGFAR